VASVTPYFLGGIMEAPVTTPSVTEKDAAITKVFNEVYVPNFLEKLASVGIKFNTMEEINDALATVTMLKQASAKVEPQNTAQPVSIIKQAALDLAKALEADKPKALDSELASALNLI
jgi:hypothetical protein